MQNFYFYREEYHIHTNIFRKQNRTLLIEKFCNKFAGDYILNINIFVCHINFVIKVLRLETNKSSEINH